ncbi:RidA family protein [Parasulfitobacter algicola]|uniref:RidA family protein n=1 Tax=Parasulfitobacter algicola TaxID=2614809 RepID=A0ABX2IVB4_9RHOB|nr:RidA family protein [Sulfitobacter algicola]NSX56866.1 RidA family protein [Sulfitobacter algicola]
MRDVIFPSDKQAKYEAYGYSAAVKSGGFLFMSGQVGINASGSVISDPAAQFQLAFTNLGGVLEAAGCGFDDIVDITSFHVDMYEHFNAFASVKQSVFPNPPFPNWTAIGVVCLAEPDLLLEVKAIAKLASFT